MEAEWLLGWAHTSLGERTAAEPHSTSPDPLPPRQPDRARTLHSAGLARLHRNRETAQKALAIADRCEYRLNQAEIHNFLARLALGSGKAAEARDHAQKAKDYAYCDGRRTTTNRPTKKPSACWPRPPSRKASGSNGAAGESLRSR